MPTADPARWIDVNLTNQTVTAYDHDSAAATFFVSTGKMLTPTITGQFKIYRKFPVADMYGPDFYLPNIPYVMYFFRGFALHGTYWHNEFGRPASHGCVNLTVADAEWLFNFASIGTVVNIRY